MIRRLFNEHPASVDESYGQHMATASYFGVRMLGAGLACLVHAVFPFLFVTTGSDTIRGLHDRMSARRASACPAHGETVGRLESAPNS